MKGYVWTWNFNVSGHKSSKTPGIYTHVGDKNIGKIKTKKSNIISDIERDVYEVERY